MLTVARNRDAPGREATAGRRANVRRSPPRNASRVVRSDTRRVGKEPSVAPAIPTNEAHDRAQVQNPRDGRGDTDRRRRPPRRARPPAVRRGLGATGRPGRTDRDGARGVRPRGPRGSRTRGHAGRVRRPLRRPRPRRARQRERGVPVRTGLRRRPGAAGRDAASGRSIRPTFRNSASTTNVSSRRRSSSGVVGRDPIAAHSRSRTPTNGRLRAVSRASSRVAHADPRCAHGCTVLTLTIAGALAGADAPLETASTTAPRTRRRRSSNDCDRSTTATTTATASTPARWYRRTTPSRRSERGEERERFADRLAALS